MAHFSQNPVVQQQKVIVPNKYGEKVVGLPHDTGSLEVVVPCHGFQRTKVSSAIDYIQRAEEEDYIQTKKEVLFIETVECLNTNMHEACLQIDKDCSNNSLTGSVDEIIPVEDAYGFAKIISNHKLQTVKGADRCYTSHQPELSSIVVDFITAALQEDEDAQK